MADLGFRYLKIYLGFFLAEQVISRMTDIQTTVFTLSIRTPQLLTILVRKFEQVQFTTRCCVQKLLSEWQTVQTLMRRRILRRLNWVYTVCLGCLSECIR